MNEWAQLVDRYAGELKKFEMICSFCGQGLTETIINTECVENCKKKDRLDQDHMSVYFTDEQPDASIFGTRRHFFAKPSNKNFKVAEAEGLQD